LDICVAIEEYLASKELSWTHDTYRWMSWMLQQRFLSWCRSQNLQELSQLTAVQVQRFVNAEPGLSDNTKHHRAQIVKGFLRWCSVDEDFGVREKMVKRIEMPKVEQPEIEIFSQQEIQRLLAAAAETRYALRNRAIVLLLLDTGVRASELCPDSDRPEERTGLLLEHVFLGQRNTESYILVMGKGRKSRTVGLGRETRLATMKYLNHERPRGVTHPYLLVAKGGEALTSRGLESVIQDLGERARVRNAHPHRFRHTFAIQQLLAGTSAFVLMQLLGHSSLESTKIYVRALSDLQARQASVSVVDELQKLPRDAPRAAIQARTRRK
jgi:site-specific recombinase XerD